jgi:hypothetical protein
VQAQELAADASLALAVPFAFGLLNVENCSFFRALPHLGHSTRSALERTSRSYVVSQSWQAYS